MQGHTLAYAPAAYRSAVAAGVNLTYGRRYARAEGGRRARQAPARRAESDAHGGPDPGRPASGYDRERGRQRCLVLK